MILPLRASGDSFFFEFVLSKDLRVNQKIDVQVEHVVKCCVMVGLSDAAEDRDQSFKG